MKKILFIGLSDKPGCAPLQGDTKSGIIIDKIIEKLNAKCYKINLVNFAPLDAYGKLRYPTVIEMENGYENLIKVIDSINPDICVLLGNKVSHYLSSKIKKNISVKHPSYIAVYQRKNIDSYIQDTAALITTNLQL